MDNRRGQAQESDRDRALTTLLTEFSQLKSEVNNRTSAQGNLATVSISITGIVLGFGLKQVSPIILAVPIVAACLGLLWLDHADQIDKIGSYIQNTLRKDLKQIVGTVGSPSRPIELLNWESEAANRKHDRAPRLGRLDFAVLATFSVPGWATIGTVPYLRSKHLMKLDEFGWVMFWVAVGIQLLYTAFWAWTMLPRRRGAEESELQGDSEDNDTSSAAAS